MCAAGQPSPELLRFYWDLGVPLVVSYGQAESLGLVSCQRDAGDAGTVGPPVPGAEVQVRDGTLYVRSGGLARTHLDGASVRASDGWLDTGDHGAIDDSGRVIVNAASQDILHRPGQPDVVLTEVEGRLRLSPYIGEAVALGRRQGCCGADPDRTWRGRRLGAAPRDHRRDLPGARREPRRRRS